MTKLTEQNRTTYYAYYRERSSIKNGTPPQQMLLLHYR